MRRAFYRVRVTDRLTGITIACHLFMDFGDALGLAGEYRAECGYRTRIAKVRIREARA